jgi:hypothetical protein
MATRKLLTLMLDLLPGYPTQEDGAPNTAIEAEPDAIDLGELDERSWPRLFAASGALWLSGRLLPVAKRVRRRRAQIS